ncbi:MAG: DUF4376 domain-containing protein [Rhodospirillales bacterium]
MSLYMKVMDGAGVGLPISRPLTVDIVAQQDGKSARVGCGHWDDAALGDIGGVYPVADFDAGLYTPSGGGVFDAEDKTVTAAVEPIPIEDVRAAKLAALAAYRYDREVGGFDFSGAHVTADDRDKTLIIGARTMAKEDSEYAKDWKVAPGQYVTLDATALIALGDALEAHVSACFANEKTHSDAIVAFEDAADIAAYDFTTGWPT